MKGGGDATISEALVVQSYNSDLANNIGNLFSRVCKLASKNFAGRIPEVTELPKEERRLLENAAQRSEKAIQVVDLNGVSELCNQVVALGSSLNLYIDSTKPWDLAKDIAQRGRLAEVLRTALEGIRLLFELASPVIPAASARALSALGQGTPTGEHRFEPNRLKGGAELGGEVVLFPRVVGAAPSAE
jgi:methionyl-tRNA synthetase